jgi:hypothetical protein
MNGVLVLAAITIATVLFIRSWTDLNARLDRDLPRLLDDFEFSDDDLRCDLYGHQWIYYADYRFCANCPAREVEPFERNAS